MYVFILINSGYLGRSELPKNSKALFRPITVVFPDFSKISENWLMSHPIYENIIKFFVLFYFITIDLLNKYIYIMF